MGGAYNQIMIVRNLNGEVPSNLYITWGLDMVSRMQNMVEIESYLHGSRWQHFNIAANVN